MRYIISYLSLYYCCTCIIVQPIMLQSCWEKAFLLFNTITWLYLEFSPVCSRFSCVYTICKVRGYAWPWTLVTNSLRAEISWTYLRQQSVDLWRKSQTPDTTASASNIIDQDDPTSVIASWSSAMVVTKHQSDYGKKNSALLPFRQKVMLSFENSVLSYLSNLNLKLKGTRRKVDDRTPHKLPRSLPKA